MFTLVSYHMWQKGQYGYHSGVRVAFVKEGRKWLQVVAMDASFKGGLRIYKVKKSELEYMKPLLRKNKPYPMRVALQMFKDFGKVHGRTKGVKRFFKELTAELAAKKKVVT